MRTAVYQISSELVFTYFLKIVSVARVTLVLIKGRAFNFCPLQNNDSLFDCLFDTNTMDEVNVSFRTQQKQQKQQKTERRLGKTAKTKKNSILSNYKNWRESKNSQFNKKCVVTLIQKEIVIEVYSGLV